MADKLDLASLKNMLQTEHNKLKHVDKAIEAISALQGLDQERKQIEAGLAKVKSEAEKAKPEYEAVLKKVADAKAEEKRILDTAKAAAESIKAKAEAERKELIHEATSMSNAAKALQQVTDENVKKATAELNALKAEIKRLSDEKAKILAKFGG